MTLFCAMDGDGTFLGVYSTREKAKKAIKVYFTENRWAEPFDFYVKKVVLDPKTPYGM